MIKWKVMIVIKLKDKGIKIKEILFLKGVK